MQYCFTYNPPNYRNDPAAVFHLRCILPNQACDNEAFALGGVLWSRPVFV